MNICKQPSHKSHRVLKLRRKLHKNELTSEPNQDYLLETSGDVRSFLSPPHIPVAPNNPMVSKVRSLNMVGTLSNAKSPKTDDTIHRQMSRKPTFSFTLRNQNRSSILISKEDSQARFINVMSRINQALEKAKVEDREKFSLLTNKERKIYSKQSQSIDAIFRPNLEKNELKNEKGMSLNEIPVKSRNRDVKSTNFNGVDQYFWYMSLRENRDSEHIESYMRIGSELNGLYTKVKKPNPKFNSSKSVKLKNKDELVVIGNNKLKMEEEAVKKVGFDYLKPELLVLDSFYKEETLAENYETVHMEISHDCLSISRIDN